MTYSYQWQRCNVSGASCGPISGATAASYIPTATDVGSTLRASVTASNSAGSASASSDPTAAISALPTPSSPSASSCNGCYWNWNGDLSQSQPFQDPANRPDVFFNVDNGNAAAIKITTGNTNCCSQGTNASLGFDGSMFGAHTSPGASTWYFMRFRFPSGHYVPVPQDWNVHEEWHSGGACASGSQSSFVGVRGYGPRGAPATSAALVFVLRGGACGSGQSEIRTADPAPLIYDHYYNVVVHYVWKQTGGSVEWYVDGQLIYSNSNFPTLYTNSDGTPDHPSFASYNYRENQISGSSEIDFDQVMTGPSAASIGFTP